MFRHYLVVLSLKPGGLNEINGMLSCSAASHSLNETQLIGLDPEFRKLNSTFFQDRQIVVVLKSIPPKASCAVLATCLILETIKLANKTQNNDKLFE